MGVSIEHIFETHNHADHVSGHGRLAAATGATIHIHRDAEPDYEHEPFDDGDEFALGALTVRALHTPGHRPEHTAFALIDTARGPEPWAVLSGDTLFVGDVARPDLAIEKSEGARGIFRSLHDQLLSLPDDVEVWPGHLGGSMCGGPGMDMKISSTIGYERANNPTLAITDEDEFVEQALAKLGPQPPNFEAIVALNRGPLLTDGVELLPARAPPGRAQARRRRAAGRRAHRPAVRRRAHRRRDLHPDAPRRVRLQARVAGRPRAGGRVRRPRRRDGRRAGRLAVAVGIRKLGGFLHGGMTSWRQEKRAGPSASSASRWTSCPAAPSGRPELQILDVREQEEWDAGHIPGSVLHDLARHHRAARRA